MLGAKEEKVFFSFFEGVGGRGKIQISVTRGSQTGSFLVEFQFK